MTERERLDLAAIRKRCEAATPGKWKVSNTPSGLGVIVASLGAQVDETSWFVESSELVGDEHLPNNAELLAHAREDIPALLDEIERLKAAIHLGAAHLRPSDRELCAYMHNGRICNKCGYIVPLPPREDDE